MDLLSIAITAVDNQLLGHISKAYFKPETKSDYRDVKIRLHQTKVTYLTR